MKKLIRALCEKAVWLVWDMFLSLKTVFLGNEVQELSKEDVRRLRRNCVRW